MKKMLSPVFLVLCFSLLGSASYSDRTVLEFNGPPGKKLDIVLVPSHYYGTKAGANPQWTADAETIRKTLLEHHFWKRYRAKINLYRLDVSLQTDFKQSGPNWAPDEEAIKAFALSKFPQTLDFKQNDQIIFVVESGGYDKDPMKNLPGLTMGHPNIVTLETAKTGALVHEFGHAFGHLGDEYNQQTVLVKSTFPNIATDQPGDKCEDKWGDLIKVVIPAPGTPIEDKLWQISRVVGCYDATAPNSTGKRYRPTSDACVMGMINDGYPFCPVCQRQLATLLEKYTPYDSCGCKAATFNDLTSFKNTADPLMLVNFDVDAAFDAKSGKPLNGHPDAIDVSAAPISADKVYSGAGVIFTAGRISQNPGSPGTASSSPNVLARSYDLEKPVVAGYFTKRVCAIGIVNTGGVDIVLRLYNAAFIETVSVTSKAAPSKQFVGVHAPQAIYRFAIEISSADPTLFSVDDLYFGRCSSP